MHQGNLSRRGFLRRALAALTGTAGLPSWYAREVLAAEASAAAPRWGPNDHILFGVIGCGSRCRQLLRVLERFPEVHIRAVCDVDRRRREDFARLVGGSPAQYHDFRQLCARKDLDAVMIVTPDHWHTLIALAAMKAGKDIYCEKPLTLTVAEGQILVKVARAGERVFQTGTQQRSDPRFRLACELVRNGRLGKLQTIETYLGPNPVGGPFPVATVPDGFDWDFWLGPSAPVAYVRQRAHFTFRWWYEYSGAKMTDWGAHHNDIAQWGLGMDGHGPVAVEATGDPPSADPHSYNVHPHFQATFLYGDGTQLVSTSSARNGVRFTGERGAWIFVSRAGLSSSAPQLLDEPLAADAVRLPVANDHMGNFLDCLRTRQRPVADVEIGHRSVSVCHIGNIALRLGRKLRWDPVKEQFQDAEANRWLRREMRPPWKIEM